MPVKTYLWINKASKFGIWSPSDRVSIISKCGCGNVFGLVLATSLGSSLAAKS